MLLSECSEALLDRNACVESLSLALLQLDELKFFPDDLLLEIALFLDIPYILVLKQVGPQDSFPKIRTHFRRTDMSQVPQHPQFGLSLAQIDLRLGHAHRSTPFRRRTVLICKVPSNCRNKSLTFECKLA